MADESPPIPTVDQAHARVAALSRWRDSDDSVTVAAKRTLDAANLAQHIKRVVDDFPPLTHEQRDRLAQLLRGGA